MVTKTRAKELLVSSLKKVCNNVHSTFVDPEKAFELTNSFPAIFIEEVETTPEPKEGRRVFRLSLVLHCVVKSNDLAVIAGLRDDLEDSVHRALNNNADGLQIIITRCNSSNLITTSPMTDGLFGPLAVFSIECQIPFARY